METHYGGGSPAPCYLDVSEADGNVDVAPVARLSKAACTSRQTVMIHCEKSPRKWLYLFDLGLLPNLCSLLRVRPRCHLQ